MEMDDIELGPARTPSRARAAAIVVRDAVKTYPLGTGAVLDGFNMTVPEGTM